MMGFTAAGVAVAVDCTRTGAGPERRREAEKPVDVLLVEDDDGHARLVTETLALSFGPAYRLRRAHDLAGATAELHPEPC